MNFNMAVIDAPFLNIANKFASLCVAMGFNPYVSLRIVHLIGIIGLFITNPTPIGYMLNSLMLVIFLLQGFDPNRNRTSNVIAARVFLLLLAGLVILIFFSTQMIVVACVAALFTLAYYGYYARYLSING